MKMSESEEKTQVLENPTSKAEIKKNQSITKKPRTSAYFWLLLGLPALFAVIVVSWFGWQQWQIMLTDLERIEYLNVELEAHLKQANSQSIITSNRELEHLENRKELSQQVINLQLQVNAQGARITELGSTTRTDWYLSEAAYLARLASQRLQTERGTKNPLALLQKVDSILVEIDEGGMLAVRAAIAADITALRLAGEIDIEGIVLELNALAVQIDELPMIQLSVNSSASNQDSDDNGLANLVVDESLSQRWSALIDEFTQSLGQLVQVKQRLQPIERVLSASEESVVRNNVRLLLQQAANAALREQQSIYDLSLKRAQQWLTQYFQMNSSVEVVKDRLIKLSVEQVVQELPFIDGSVNALEAFMIVRQSNLIEGSAGVVEIEAVD
ncbi:MAG: uroporphyrin-3 C-methyltransferase [Porticoccaceae bacterium]|jgi:uroporphyrin-3 C-methyltransferase|tara:strand:- start:887 stop:2047 length:1161 start_codon:yes stop_codon:yes gene_type:complete